MWWVWVAILAAGCGRLGFGSSDVDATGDNVDAPNIPVGGACTVDADCTRCARCDATLHCAAEPINALYLGHRSLCYLGTGGSRWCAGENNQGDLGLGDVAVHKVPTRIAGEDGWTALYLGYTQSRGFRQGELYSWGNSVTTIHDDGAIGTLVAYPTDSYGACGVRSTGVLTCDPTAVTDWISYDTGGNYGYCGVRANHTLWCWGTSSSSDLGQGVIPNDTKLANPTQVGTATDWVAVALGSVQACAIKLDGTMWCWGDRFYTGTNNVDTLGVPVQINADTDWVSVTASWGHTCATKKTGAIWCWGQDTYGGMIIPGVIDAAVPMLLGGPYDQFLNGSHGGCKLEGTVWQCFGWNAAGQLGVGDTVVHPGFVDLCPA